MITKINHIAIVVPDLERGAQFWVQALGLDIAHVEDVPEQRVKVAFVPVGDSNIELLEPTDDQSGVARYLQKRGPGIHHLCLEVEDIEAALDGLRAAGIPLIDEEPRPGANGKKYAFVHPKGTGGVLVELYQL
jgi:methylmalonyl-CoA/ethylmalonyl-CoA epimerase